MRSAWSRAAFFLIAGATGIGCNWILGIHELGDNRTDAGDAGDASDEDGGLILSFWRPPEAGSGDVAADSAVDAHDADAANDYADAGCGAGRIACDGGCVSVSNGNCGSCGVVCDGGTVCSENDAGAYACLSTCSGATPDSCGGECVNEANDETPDAANCGGCGASYACSGGMTCQDRRCECRAGSSTCGGSLCIDLQGSDSNNCGACGHRCMGGACVSGHCQPYTLVAPAPGGGPYGGLSVDQTALYAQGGGGAGSPGVYSFDKTSGTTLGTAGPFVDIHAFTTTVAYGVSDPPLGSWEIDLFTLPTLGGGSRLYTNGSAGASPNVPFDVATSGATLLWVDGQGGLYRGRVEGDTFAPVTTLSSAAGKMVVGDSAGFVWPDVFGGLSAATESSLDTPVTLAAPNGQPAALIVDSTNVYWFDSSSGTIFRAARDGSGTYVLMASPAFVNQFAIDDTNLYWLDAATGSIYGLPKSATTVTSPSVVANGISSPAGVAVDENAFYWSAGKAIYRLAR